MFTVQRSKMIVVAKERHLEKHATSKNGCRYSSVVRFGSREYATPFVSILVWLSVLSHSDFHLIGALPSIFVFHSSTEPRELKEAYPETTVPSYERPKVNRLHGT